MVRRGFWVTVCVAGLGTSAWFGARTFVPDSRVLASPKRVPAPSAGPSPSPSAAPSAPSAAQEPPHVFRLPSGVAPALSCESARAVVRQVRQNLAYSPEPVAPAAFATATGDWMDPYGLWSVAPDAPVGALLESRAESLLAEIEGRGAPGCPTASAIGRALRPWVDELRARFDEASRDGAGGGALDALTASPFEGATVTRPARGLATLLGERIGAARAVGPVALEAAAVARSRYFPAKGEAEWAGVALAAAVRAYVPLVDPHGAWAPLDEEASVYEVDLEARPPTRFWDKCTRTALGLKVDSGARPPLSAGDVVLSIAGVSTAGLPMEQAEQLGYAAGDVRGEVPLTVLRRGEQAPVVLTAGRLVPAERAAGAAPDLLVERVPFGEGGDALVVPIHDVRDDLGEALTRALLHERAKDDRPPVGVVLDLRGNGGGSTDGAIDALGLFLPGVPLFPMKRRDGSLETDRAPEPPAVDRWTGPVAALVDGETASAAEMIAGALAAYRRGVTVGTGTFGKGCAQEYVDDEARAGVLRLTTLLYALPDGAPVQRVGLSPMVRLTPSNPPPTSDREALLPHAPPSWRGPDVRDRPMLARADAGTWTWPAHRGQVGPCHDPEVCRALVALGGARPQATRIAKGR